jgi:hypothetical protein
MNEDKNLTGREKDDVPRNEQQHQSGSGSRQQGGSPPVRRPGQDWLRGETPQPEKDQKR